MKKFMLVIGLLSCMPLSLHAKHTDEDRSMAIGISPIALIFGGADLLYQVKVTRFLAITVPARFHYDWVKAKALKVITDRYSALTQTSAPIGWSAGIGARFLLAGEALNDSFYLEPRVSLGYSQFGIAHQDTKIESAAWKVTPMGWLGWDWFFDSGFYTGIGGGLGMNIFFKNKTDVPKEIRDNFILSTFFPEKKISLEWDLEFKIGYSW